ncbi:MAG TPA: prephenate dehydratase domain-containing protein [Polyangiaceae bacterium]|nr:prephenate dehydratase domain-containing protein [Polyangiaceae bacterium]
MTTTIDKIYALGPEGTISDTAAQRLNDHLTRAGQIARAEVVYTRTIPEALELAARDANARAVAPIENSEVGTVVATQDNLAKYGLYIEWEIRVKVRFNIVSDVPLAEVKRLYAHPVALEQCNALVARRIPEAESIFTRSNVDSGVRWANELPEARSAALVPWDYAPARPAAVVTPDVQNDARNTTRFVVVRGGGGARTHDFRRAKTSILIEPDADRPGLLFEIVGVFEKYGINLSRIESRPARTGPWAYVFYMDIANNEKTGDAVSELEAGPWRAIVLGTYDVLS